ncbi:MAG: ABC transporter ATP-binding protein [Armatimonadota bacterium]
MGEEAGNAGGRAGVALEVRGVSKSYRLRARDLVAIDRVSFDVPRGRFVSIVGPSGCGKSTLLKIILGVIPPSDGKILFDGRPVTGPQPNIGMVFQSPTLLAWRPVLANVLLPVEIRRYPRARYSQRAQELLAMVGLSEFQTSYPRQLSGGMQQRAAICRALIIDPPLLLFDEPFSALDGLTRDQLNQEVLEIWDRTGKTILLVTHNIEEAVYMSDQVIVMSARPGTVTAIVHVDLPRPRQLAVRQTAAFFDCVNRIRTGLGM